MTILLLIFSIQTGSVTSVKFSDATSCINTKQEINMDLKEKFTAKCVIDRG